MPDSGVRDVILDADSDQAILSVDFPVREHREAGFVEFSEKLGSKYRFLRVQLPTPHPDEHLSGEVYVDHWINEVWDRRPILAVFGYRIGSVYAAAIAERLARWQPPPRVILFDPQFASSKLLSRELHKEISSISSLLSDDEIERAGKLAAEIAESEHGDIATAAAMVAGIYWEFSSIAYDRAGIGDGYCSKFFAPFESYISLISMADQIDPVSVWKRSIAIMSSSYANPPDSSPLADDARDIIGHSIPFDVSHSDLLRSDSVAQAVLDLLEGNRCR